MIKIALTGLFNRPIHLLLYFAINSPPKPISSVSLHEALPSWYVDLYYVRIGLSFIIPLIRVLYLSRISFFSQFPKFSPCLLFCYQFHTFMSYFI